MLLVDFNKYLLNFKHYFEKTEIFVKNTFIGTLGQKGWRYQIFISHQAPKIMQL